MLGVIPMSSNGTQMLGDTGMSPVGPRCSGSPQYLQWDPDVADTPMMSSMGPRRWGTLPTPPVSPCPSVRPSGGGPQRARRRGCVRGGGGGGGGGNCAHMCACVRAVHTRVPRWLWGVGGGRGTRGEGRAPGQACVAHACAPGGALKSSTHLCRAHTPPGPHHHSGTQPKPPGGRPCSGGGGVEGGTSVRHPHGDSSDAGPPLGTPVSLVLPPW